MEILQAVLDLNHVEKRYVSCMRSFYALRIRIEVNIFRRDAEEHENPELGYPVSGSRLESSTPEK